MPTTPSTRRPAAKPARGPVPGSTHRTAPRADASDGAATGAWPGAGTAPAASAFGALGSHPQGWPFVEAAPLDERSVDAVGHEREVLPASS